MRILCVCTAGRTRSVWMRDFINSEIEGVTAEARGISGRIVDKNRRFSIYRAGLDKGDLILAVSPVHAAFARGYQQALCRQVEVVTVAAMRNYKTDPERARASIRRIVERRMNK